MKKITTILATLLFSVFAFANHCPKDMKAIDAALAKKPQLSEEEMKEVTTLRADGEKLHKAGKHKESEEALAKAMAILKIK